MSAQAAWLAVDWGTSHLRVWVMDASNAVIETRRSDRGMGALAPEDFEPALLNLVGDVLPATGAIPAVICGMAGSRQGWREAAYATVPCAPPGITQATRVETTDPRLRVYILPGIKQDKPADVMRGEETQIAGVFARHPGFDGVICLPGTHCKWVHVSAGEVVSFRTAMTGEMFSLLSKHSVLRHSVGEDWEAEAYTAAIDDAMSRPATVLADLFSLRAESLLHGLSRGAARARLSGLLIGLDLAGARPYWLGQPVMIVGAGALADAYATALEAQGVEVHRTSADEITLAGLCSAAEELRETT